MNFEHNPSALRPQGATAPARVTPWGGGTSEERMLTRACQSCGESYETGKYNRSGRFCSLRCMFFAKVERREPAECWPWLAATSEYGYGQLMCVLAGRTRALKATRVMWMFTYGAWPGDLDVLHSCDNPPCVNPAHLHLGDARLNAKEMVERGRQRGPRGDAHPLAKLTEAQVVVIRARHAQGGISIRALAREYSVSHTAMRFVVDGSAWKSATGGAR